MFETMRAAKGIGLAAPQVGRLERIAVVDVGEGGARRPIALVNPEIVSLDSKSEKSEEGCLSIPDIFGDVERRSEEHTSELQSPCKIVCSLLLEEKKV